MFREAWVDEVPDGATHQSGMTADDRPELVHASTRITCDRQILVHERRTWILRFGHHRRVHLQLVRRWIARSDDVFGRMSVGIASIHEVTCGVEAFALLHHFRNQRAFATLVACTPEQHAGVVAVAQYQFLYAFHVHLTESLVVGDICIRWHVPRRLSRR